MDLDWEKLVDEAKRRANVSSDADIARVLGVTRAAISEWRNKRNDLGMLTKLRILDLLAYQGARDMLLALLPKNKSKEIIEINNKLTERFTKDVDHEEK